MSDDPGGGPPGDDAPPIFGYSRAQALADGVLVDLSAWAGETGFRVPVACTRTLWEGLIVPPPGTRALGQSERGRAHDLLFLLLVAIRRGRGAGGASELRYRVRFLVAGGRHEDAELKAVCGPGDGAEPVITIMLPGED